MYFIDSNHITGRQCDFGETRKRTRGGSSPVIARGLATDADPCNVLFTITTRPLTEVSASTHAHEGAGKSSTAAPFNG